MNRCIFLWTITGIAFMSKRGLQIARCFWINSFIYVLFDFYPGYFISFTFIHVRFNEYTSIKMFYYSKCPLKLVLTSILGVNTRDGEYAYLLLYFIGTFWNTLSKENFFQSWKIKSNLCLYSCKMLCLFFHIQDNIAQNLKKEN